MLTAYEVCDLYIQRKKVLAPVHAGMRRVK